ncbi:MAG: type IV pili twitching motility protein PilT, partial [Psychromonas sp.]|nr:type IV pili twitching motility protein PilT [Psychromonas sp.]
IINFFPEERRPQLLNDLGNNLKSFISQRLVPTVDGKRCAAIEVMMGTLTVRDMIKKGELGLLKDVMEKSKNLGMQTFDGALFDLAIEGRISEEEATKNSDSPTNIALKFKLHKGGIAEQAEAKAKKEGGGLTLEPKVSFDDLDFS